MENLYQVLKCEETANYQDLKKAFSELALKWHPDKTGQNDKQSAETFNYISHAWSILSDPDLKKEYDIRWKERCLAQTYPIQDTIDFEEFDFVKESEEDTDNADEEDLKQSKETCELTNEDAPCVNENQDISGESVKGETDVDRDGETDRTSGWFVYSCRCGGQYVLTETDVQLKFDIVCCDSCTLTVQVLYSS